MTEETGEKFPAPTVGQVRLMHSILMFRPIDEATIAHCKQLLPEDDGIGELLGDLNENIEIGLKDKSFEAGCFRLLAALVEKFAGPGNEEQYIQVLEAGALKLAAAKADPVASSWH